MQLPKVAPVYLVAGLAVGVLVLWALSKAGGAGGAAGAAGQAIGQAAGDAAAGVVVGLGASVGIPATDADQCSIDLAAGDLWAASFSCPAPRYLKAITTGDYGGGMASPS